MTPEERAVLDAAMALGISVRRYNTFIEGEYDFRSEEYRTLANTMEACEAHLIEALDPLLPKEE